jgi:hypothetical protein
MKSGKIPLIIIGTLILVIAYMAKTIVRIENERYALSLGMCANKVNPELPPDWQCVKTVHTRTHWSWHLYYALAPWENPR